ncbi:hypothetical protein AB0D63_35320 [Kitasatospora sp. NPDC048343]|uniref:hypothetical protein n=1 Tax=Kitasatospora sp. NPDC048343 TaxID=3154717 RepID=UPI003407020D
MYNTTGGSGYYFGLPGVNTFCWPWSAGRLVKRLHTFIPDTYIWTKQQSEPRTGRPAGGAVVPPPASRQRAHRLTADNRTP